MERAACRGERMGLGLDGGAPTLNATELKDAVALRNCC